MTEITNSEVIKAWSAAYDHADTFGEEGDFAHQHLLNPAIFTKGERESPGIHALSFTHMFAKIGAKRGG